ncbi:MAG: hypothetical protein ACJA1H_001096 [Glaciecola sp.]|jgi:hypothetical protein
MRDYIYQELQNKTMIKRFYCSIRTLQTLHVHTSLLYKTHAPALTLVLST